MRGGVDLDFIGFVMKIQIYFIRKTNIHGDYYKANKFKQKSCLMSSIKDF